MHEKSFEIINSNKKAMIFIAYMAFYVYFYQKCLKIYINSKIIYDAFWTLKDSIN